VYYEHIWDHEHHDHLVCSRCGRRIEFYYPAIDILQERWPRSTGSPWSATISSWWECAPIASKGRKRQGLERKIMKSGMAENSCMVVREAKS
jgi:hypothetical protein